jgi:hypothetical protein
MLNNAAAVADMSSPAALNAGKGSIIDHHSHMSDSMKILRQSV